MKHLKTAFKVVSHSVRKLGVYFLCLVVMPFLCCMFGHLVLGLWGVLLLGGLIWCVRNVFIFRINLFWCWNLWRTVDDSCMSFIVVSLFNLKFCQPGPLTRDGYRQVMVYLNWTLMLLFVNLRLELVLVMLFVMLEVQW